MTQSAQFTGLAPRRRTKRLTISVPITVSGLDASGNTFTEHTSTVDVNQHGARIHTRYPVKPRDPIHIENRNVKLAAKATIAWVSERRQANQPYEIGVALTEPQNIWGIDFPPGDWSEARAAPLKNQTAAQCAAPAAVMREAPSGGPKLPVPAAAVNQPPRLAEAPGETQVGVTPPVLAPVVPKPGNGDAHASPQPAPAPAVAVADVQAAAAQLAEQMKLLAEAHSRLFQKEFADLAAGIRENLQKEIQQMVESTVHDAGAKVRGQMQHDLEQFAGQITELERQVTDAGVSGLRKRLTAMLAALDTPPGHSH